MEQTPADARAAPSASAPNDTVMDIHASPKRQRESSQGNMIRTARHMYALRCCDGCRVRFVMIDLFYNNGSTTT